MNKALRNKDRSGVKLWRNYIWLLMHALKKLPAAETTHVVRGAKATLAGMGLELSEGDEFTRSGFSSVASTIDVMKTFLGDSGDRAMIQLELVEQSARDIRDFSFFPSENELLLPPNVCFEFVSKFQAGGGLEIVQAKQIESLDVILDLQDCQKKFVAGSGAKAVAKPKDGHTSGSSSQQKSSKGVAESDSAHEVRALLESIGLSMFADAFITNGWDELGLLNEMSDNDFKELGLGGGHRKKLNVRLASLSNAVDDAKEKAEAEEKAKRIAEERAAEERARKAAEKKAAEEKAKMRGSKGWRIRAETTKSGWAWDVKKLAFFSGPECFELKLSECEVLHSGCVSDPEHGRIGGYEPEHAFRQNGAWWGGRKGKDVRGKECFYIGLRCRDFENVSFVEIEQGDTHYADTITIECLEADGRNWKAIARQNGLQPCAQIVVPGS